MQVMPFVVDHCSRGFVNHVVVTGSETCDLDSMSPEDEERFQKTLALIERINPGANVIHAPRGQFLHNADFDVIIRDDSFDAPEAGKMRHLLFPGWWDRGEAEKAKREGADQGGVASANVSAALGAKIWPHVVTCIAFKFPRCLDKKKLARELKIFKSKRDRPTGGYGDGGGTGGLIFVVTGEVRFEEDGVVTSVNYSAAADKLTCYAKIEEEKDEDNPMEKKKKKSEGVAEEKEAEKKESEIKDEEEEKDKDDSVNSQRL